MSLSQERLASQTFTPKWIWLEHLARFEFGCKFVKDKIVVDCASGSGIGSRMFAASGAKEVRAFDISASSSIPPLLGEGQGEGSRHDSLNDAISFTIADACSLPLPDNSIDVYISFETIEHIDNDEGYLKEATRVIKPGGIFICSTPNRAITNPGKTINDKPWNKFHAREYNQEEFVVLLSKYFFNIELYGQNPAGKFRTKLMTALGRLLPSHGAVRLNQILKLPRLIWDKKENRRVQPGDMKKEFEYLVAACEK